VWKYEIRGLDPTVSDAISSASAKVDAERNPIRCTDRRSPPTKITSPRYSIACAPQYHM